MHRLQSCDAKEHQNAAHLQRDMTIAISLLSEGLSLRSATLIGDASFPRFAHDELEGLARES